MRLEGRFNADSDELHPAESQPIEATLDAFHPRGTEEYFLRQLYWRPTSFMGIPTAQLHRGNFQERIHFFPFTAIFRGTRIDRRERAFAKLSCRRQKLYDQVRSKFPLDEAILENVERNVTTEYSLSDRSLKVRNATFNFIPVHTYLVKLNRNRRAFKACVGKSIKNIGENWHRYIASANKTKHNREIVPGQNWSWWKKGEYFFMRRLGFIYLDENRNISLPIQFAASRRKKKHQIDLASSVFDIESARL